MPVSREALGGDTPVYIDEVHRFTTDSVLLAEFCGIHRLWRAADLGSGCGIIPLYWHDRGHTGPADGLELTESGTALLKRAAEEAGISHIRPLCGDLRNLPPEMEPGSYDLVSCNPPYFTGGIESPVAERRQARHELTCTLADVCAAAARLLKTGGRLCICCPPARLTDALTAMRAAGLEPKRLQFVKSSPDATPRLFLLDGRREGKPGLDILPDLIQK